MVTIKKTGTFQGEPNMLGGGGRFKQMVASGKSPALASFIGRKLYGKKKMTKMAIKGKKDNEKDKGKKETKAHEKSESKKVESKE